MPSTDSRSTVKDGLAVSTSKAFTASQKFDTDAFDPVVSGPQSDVDQSYKRWPKVFILFCIIVLVICVILLIPLIISFYEEPAATNESPKCDWRSITFEKVIELVGTYLPRSTATDYISYAFDSIPTSFTDKKIYLVVSYSMEPIWYLIEYHLNADRNNDGLVPSSKTFELAGYNGGGHIVFRGYFYYCIFGSTGTTIHRLYLSGSSSTAISQSYRMPHQLQNFWEIDSYISPIIKFISDGNDLWLVYSKYLEVNTISMSRLFTTEFKLAETLQVSRQSHPYTGAFIVCKLLYLFKQNGSISEVIRYRDNAPIVDNRKQQTLRFESGIDFTFSPAGYYIYVLKHPGQVVVYRVSFDSK